MFCTISLKRLICGTSREQQQKVSVTCHGFTLITGTSDSNDSIVVLKAIHSQVFQLLQAIKQTFIQSRQIVVVQAPVPKSKKFKN